ncbi:hypothetical protein C5167_012446 [Papaver somniferum]|uniref:Peptidase M16 C-terminal domain-containing protein n=1 Tax=Papaver somniferum TaxID=3469 RepID=A0A4Y7J0Q0_PAPSO|nr:hypothetical protein C5167_012446 [Papaver somniferum]
MVLNERIQQLHEKQLLRHSILLYVKVLMCDLGISSVLKSALKLLLTPPIRVANLHKVDPIKACEYFGSCFKDPSSFTVVIVGNLDPASAHPLILQYLV